MPDGNILTEEHWTDVTTEIGKGPYIKSKTLAEKAAWDFLKALPDDEKFELVTINPCLVVGPSLCGPGYGSQKIVSDMVTGKMPGMGRLMVSLVDVRDVAEAHVRALETPEAAGKRIIISAKDMWFEEFGKIVHDEFAPQGYDFSLSVPPYCVMRFVSLFNKDAAFMMPVYGKEFYY